MEKRIAVVVDDEVRDQVIMPGTTSQEVLESLNIPGTYWLTPRSGEPFGDTEAIWDQVTDGEKVYATPKANVATH